MALIENEKAGNVLKEVSAYLDCFASLLSWELSDEARAVIAVIMQNLLDETPDTDTEDSDDSFLNSLPIEPEDGSQDGSDNDPIYDGSVRPKVKVVGEKVTVSDLVAHYLASVKNGSDETPTEYIKNEINLDLKCIGFKLNSDAYCFLMNACNIDYTDKVFKGHACDNIFICERVLKQQFKVNLNASSALDSVSDTSYDLNNSIFFGFGGNYKIGSMSVLDLMDSYLEIISGFKIAIASKE